VTRSWGEIAVFGSTLAIACSHARTNELHVRAQVPSDRASDRETTGPTRWFGDLEAALAVATPGTTIVVHGRLALTEQIQVRVSGRQDAWIRIVGEATDTAILDASRIVVAAPGGGGPSMHDDGTITLRGVHHVVVGGLTIVDSHSAAIAIHDSTDIDVIGNHAKGSFASGIAAWDSDHRPGGCERVRILGNHVLGANDVELAPEWFERTYEPPHEAISIGGAVDFEVAFNEVALTHKEGIDVKETSARGRVHHNHVHDAARQCYYVDAWFGPLVDIEVDHNLGERCAGAGLAISVEGKTGSVIERLEVHDNILRDNLGSGILFGRWGGDGPRRDLSIHHNTVERNGNGLPKLGRAYYWITGGMFLLSANVQRMDVRANRFVDNRGFQIGFGDAWLATTPDIGAAFATAALVFADNFARGDIAHEPIDVGDDERAARVREWPIDGGDAKAAGARLDPREVGTTAFAGPPV
jgi:hypothetical protein